MDLGDLKRKLLGLDQPMVRWHSDKTRSWQVDSNIDARKLGQDHPVHGFTMIGQKRLDSIHQAMDDISDKGTPGDLIECGVWRGGVCMFMAAYCAEFGMDKKIYVADSFQGLPIPTMKEDVTMYDHLHEHLRVSEEDVRNGFIELGIPLDNVVFVKGWFKDTLPTLWGHQWALVRADGDMYESTMNIMDNLYPGLQSGGHMVVDDYGCIVGCRNAIEIYRKEHGITEDILRIDWTGARWVKT